VLLVVVFICASSESGHRFPYLQGEAMPVLGW
jgi:hypothetical protein